MNIRRVIAPTVVALSTVALLAACATTGTAQDSSGGSKAGAGSASGAADCSAFARQTDPALKLFTTDAIASGPTEGQKYGDGTELAITLSADAIAAGFLPEFELNNLSKSGEPVGISSEIFDPTTGSDGTYSTTNKLFGKDELVGTAMVLQVFTIADTAIGTTEKYGDKVLLGNYCLSYANDGS
ncbi:MAG: hypothetical protein ABIP33_02870 [Pseudolysinimonas sp.]